MFMHTLDMVNVPSPISFSATAQASMVYQEHTGNIHKSNMALVALKDARRCKCKEQTCTECKPEDTIIHYALCILFAHLITNGSFHEPSTKYWIKDYPSDKQILVEGDWLTDSVINAVQTLSKKSFPHVGGLQPTTLADTLGFAIERGEFIQILHVSNNH